MPTLEALLEPLSRNRPPHNLITKHRSSQKSRGSRSKRCTMWLVISRHRDTAWNSAYRSLRASRAPCSSRTSSNKARTWHARTRAKVVWRIWPLRCPVTDRRLASFLTPPTPRPVRSAPSRKRIASPARSCERLPGRCRALLRYLIHTQSRSALVKVSSGTLQQEQALKLHRKNQRPSTIIPIVWNRHSWSSIRNPMLAARENMSLTIKAPSRSSAMARSITRRSQQQRLKRWRSCSCGQLRPNSNSIRPQTTTWCQCLRRVLRRTLKTARSNRASFRPTFASNRSWWKWFRIELRHSVKACSNSSFLTTCLSLILSRTVIGSHGSMKRWCTREEVWGPPRRSSAVLRSAILASTNKLLDSIRLRSTSQYSTHRSRLLGAQRPCRDSHASQVSCPLWTKVWTPIKSYYS